MMDADRQGYVYRIATRLLAGESCITFPPEDVANARVMAGLSDGDVIQRYRNAAQAQLKVLYSERKTVREKLKEMKQNA